MCGVGCCTSTKAIPEFSGIAASNFLNASSPPADAPIPTTARGRSLRVSEIFFLMGFLYGFHSSNKGFKAIKDTFIYCRLFEEDTLSKKLVKNGRLEVREKQYG